MNQKVIHFLFVILFRFLVSFASAVTSNSPFMAIQADIFEFNHVKPS